MEILIKGAQLILSLSILVVLHEMGHFLPARWFKTRVGEVLPLLRSLVLALEEEGGRYRVRHRLVAPGRLHYAAARQGSENIPSRVLAVAAFVIQPDKQLDCPLEYTPLAEKLLRSNAP